jgi:hypothetical protein
MLCPSNFLRNVELHLQTPPQRKSEIMTYTRAVQSANILPILPASGWHDSTAFSEGANIKEHGESSRVPSLLFLQTSHIAPVSGRGENESHHAKNDRDRELDSPVRLNVDSGSSRLFFKWSVCYPEYSCQEPLLISLLQRLSWMAPPLPSMVTTFHTVFMSITRPVIFGQTTSVPA